MCFITNKYYNISIVVNQNHHQYCHNDIVKKKLLLLTGKSLLNDVILKEFKKTLPYILIVFFFE